MKRFWNLLRQPAFHGLLFGLSLISLSWPFVGICRSRHAGALFVYLFGIWAILILLLVLVSRSLRDSQGPGEGNSEAAHD